MEAGLLHRWKGLFAAILLLALVAGSMQPAAARPSSRVVDARGAAAMLDLLEAAAGGEPWSRTCIAELLATPAYAAVVAHHRRLDDGVTGASMLQVLATLQEGEALSVRIGRPSRQAPPSIFARDHGLVRPFRYECCMFPAPSTTSRLSGWLFRLFRSR